MKILHLISQRPDSTGSGIYLQAMLREASARNHQNAVIAGCNSADVFDINLVRRNAIRTVRFNTQRLNFSIPGMSDVMPYASSRFKNLTENQLESYESAFLSEVNDLINIFQPDILHSHHLWLLSSLVKINFKSIPMVTSCHGSDLRQLVLCPHLRQRVVSGCRQIEKVFALTQRQKTEITLKYGIPANKIEVIGAGFNAEIFHMKGRQPSEVPTLLYCGKLSRAKGVPWLLKALDKLSALPWHLHLVGSGSGEELDECLTLAKRLGSKATIHGGIRQKELASLLRQSHIFILPSLYEGLPLVILEALACGCKIVTTKLPGCLEISRKINANLLTYIELPRLHQIDRPFKEDEVTFENNLRRAIKSGLQLLPCQSIDSEMIKEITGDFSWKSIFGKIEKQYSAMIS